MNIPDATECDDYGEFVAERRKAKIYHRQYMNHSDCRDPDHPGCAYCDDSEDEEE